MDSRMKEGQTRGKKKKIQREDGLVEGLGDKSI